MLLEMVVVLCLSSHPAECRELYKLTEFEDHQSCLLNAISEVALLMVKFPQYKVKEVFCRKALASA